jgi:arylformamidase
LRYHRRLHCNQPLSDMHNPQDYYNRQFNARAAVPDHAHIFTRWQKQSAHVRRTQACLLDIGYGEEAGERLDLFPSRRRNAPLLVFIHGGWWRSLDKSDFSFIAPGFLEAGCNVALTNYTLAPAASLEAIVRQQLKALAWLYRNAEQYDIDASRIVVAGHSAGAHLSAMMLAARWPEYEDDLPMDLVKGGVLLSGLYDLEPLQHADYVNVDLKLKTEHIGPLSPAFMPKASPAPFVTAVGGLESEEFHRQNALIAANWKEDLFADVTLPQRNHMTICDALAAPGDPLFEAAKALLDKL